MDKPLIRPAGPADVAAITAIYAEAVDNGTATFELEAPDETEMARRMSTLGAGDYPYVVAEADGVVAGYAYAGPFHTRPGYRHTVEDAIYIAPSNRRRGLGRALLGRLIEEAAERNYRQMIAIVGDSGHTASIGLHEAMGFSVAGTLKAVGHKFGRWLDIVYLQRPLGPGDDSQPTLKPRPASKADR